MTKPNTDITLYELLEAACATNQAVFQASENLEGAACEELLNKYEISTTQTLTFLLCDIYSKENLPEQLRECKVFIEEYLQVGIEAGEQDLEGIKMEYNTTMEVKIFLAGLLASTLTSIGEYREENRWTSELDED